MLLLISDPQAVFSNPKPLDPNPEQSQIQVQLGVG